MTSASLKIARMMSMSPGCLPARICVSKLSAQPQYVLFSVQAILRSAHSDSEIKDVNGHVLQANSKLCLAGAIFVIRTLHKALTCLA
jgi:hypothetical protein